MIDSAIPKRVDVYNPIITTANMKGVPLRIISMRKCNGFGDDINQTPFLYDGSTPNQLPPMARVLTVDLNNEAVAYPYDVLREQNIINDTVGGNDVVIFWAEGTASALDTGNIPDGREVGSTAAYSRVVNGTTLNFEFKDGEIFDTQTGNEWNILGHAIAGELQGKQLNPVVSINLFWFSWSVFKPATKVYQP